MAANIPDLLGLPRELRNVIYEYYLRLIWDNFPVLRERTPYGQLDAVSTACLFPWLDRLAPTRNARSPIAALLLTNMQIKNEFSEAIARHAQHVMVLPHDTWGTEFLQRGSNNTDRGPGNQQTPILQNIPAHIRCSLQTLEIQFKIREFNAVVSEVSRHARQAIQQALQIFLAVEHLTVTLMFQRFDEYLYFGPRHWDYQEEFLTMRLPVGIRGRRSRLKTFKKLVVAQELHPGAILYGRVDKWCRRSGKIVPEVRQWRRDFWYGETLFYVSTKHPELLDYPFWANKKCLSHQYMDEALESMKEYQDTFYDLDDTYGKWETAGKPTVRQMRRAWVEREVELAFEDIPALSTGSSG